MCRSVGQLIHLTVMASSMKLQWCYGIFIVLIVLNYRCSARLIDRDIGDRPVPELVARCRASCIEKFLDEMSIEECHDQANCSMCYDFCQFLYLERRTTIKSICTDYICVSIGILIYFYVIFGIFYFCFIYILW